MGIQLNTTVRIIETKNSCMSYSLDIHQKPWFSRKFTTSLGLTKRLSHV